MTDDINIKSIEGHLTVIIFLRYILKNILRYTYILSQTRFTLSLKMRYIQTFLWITTTPYCISKASL